MNNINTSKTHKPDIKNRAKVKRTVGVIDTGSFNPFLLYAITTILITISYVISHHNFGVDNNRANVIRSVLFAVVYFILSYVNYLIYKSRKRNYLTVTIILSLIVGISHLVRVYLFYTLGKINPVFNKFHIVVQSGYIIIFYLIYIYEEFNG